MVEIVFKCDLCKFPTQAADIVAISIPLRGQIKIEPEKDKVDVGIHICRACIAAIKGKAF